MIWLYLRSEREVRAYVEECGYSLISLELKYFPIKSPFRITPFHNTRIYRASLRNSKQEIQEAWIRCGKPRPKDLKEMLIIEMHLDSKKNA